MTKPAKAIPKFANLCRLLLKLSLNKIVAVNYSNVRHVISNGAYK